MGRRLGQHFLNRPSILERIAQALCPERLPLVLEIGPGKGALTSHLLERADRVVAVEIDPVLVQYLRSKYRGEPRLEIVESDILRTDLTQWGAMAVAGNLPYYITSPIIDKVLDWKGLIRAAFLVQKEVAERITTGPGSRDFGYLSVATQFRADAKLLFTVPAGAFRPPPKVDSAVVLLTPRPWEGAPDADTFLRFAGACFRHKRKTLRNNLAGVYPKELLAAMPEGGERAEQMSIAHLIGLFNKLTS